MKRKKIIKSKEIDLVNVTVIQGDCVNYKIPRTFTGEKIEQWRRVNREEIESFIKSVDPKLLERKNHKRRKVKTANKKLSDYQGSTGFSRKLIID